MHKHTLSFLGPVTAFCLHSVQSISSGNPEGIILECTVISANSLHFRGPWLHTARPPCIVWGLLLGL